MINTGLNLKSDKNLHNSLSSRNVGSRIILEQNLKLN